MVKRDATEARREPTALGNMVLVVSQDGSICNVLEAPEILRASDKTSLVDASIDDLWPPAQAETVRKNIKRTIRSRQFHGDEAEHPVDGRNYEFIYVPQGRDRVLLVIRDISDSKDALTRIKQLAYTDEVTELPNRLYLFHELQKITDVQRLKDGRAAVICIHIDPFDDDAHALVAGHEDEVLKELASRLTTQLRGINDASQVDYERYSVVSRTDFRQFTIVLPSIESGEDAESVVLRLLDALAQPITIGTRDVCATTNGGVALFPQDGTDPDALYRNAVAAMEDARNSLSGSFRFHSGTVRLRNLQRQDLAVDLKTALDRDDFALEFLPIVDAQTRSVRSVEALLRWPETILGSRATSKVVKIAEYTGLIVDIGEWVLHRACEQLGALQAAGHEEVRVAINLSGQEFSRMDVARRIAAILQDAHVDASRVDVEITEQMVYRDALRNHSTCRDLKSIGVGIVIDDFGTGASMLAHLSQSLVDAIKIDRSFVAKIEASDRDRAACAAAIALAHGLGMRVVAEGVETDAQAEFLHGNGCDWLQGFLFSRPLAGADLIRYLDEAARAGSKRARIS